MHYILLEIALRRGIKTPTEEPLEPAVLLEDDLTAPSALEAHNQAMFILAEQIRLDGAKALAIKKAIAACDQLINIYWDKQKSSPDWRVVAACKYQVSKLRRRRKNLTEQFRYVPKSK